MNKTQLKHADESLLHQKQHDYERFSSENSCKQILNMINTDFFQKSQNGDRNQSGV